MPVNRLMKFVELCRACGITIRPSESVAFTADVAHVPLEDKAFFEEATVASLAKDSESEVIVRKLFRLFFTGRPASEDETSNHHAVDFDTGFDGLDTLHDSTDSIQASDTQSEDAPLASALQKALESSEKQTDLEAAPQASDIEQTASAPADRLPRPQPFPENMTPPLSQQAASDQPQRLDRSELMNEVAQFTDDNLSGRDLERIIELLEHLQAIQEAATEDGDEEKEGREEGKDGRTKEGERPQSAIGKGEKGREGEGENSELGCGQMGESTSSRFTAPFRESRPGMGGSAHPEESHAPGPAFQSSLQNLPPFHFPFSPEAAQALTGVFVEALINGDILPSLGGRLTQLMNPEQGRNLARQHQTASELWLLTERERDRLLAGLECVVGRLLLDGSIAPQEFAEYSALFDESLKAQTTIAGAGAETHLKNVEALDTLLTQYKSSAPLQGAIVRQLSATMHRLLSRHAPIYAKSAGGKLDVRKTIRQSLQYGGSPMEFIYREKVLGEDIILALDTSGSQAWWAVSAMLFAGAFEKIARRLRVYSFTSDIEDVTKYVPFPEKFVRHLEDFAGYSNYETSFQRLLDKAPIFARTTLIIVGDCRDYQGSWWRKSLDKYRQRIDPQSAKLMGKLVSRSHKVVVLNPEAASKWGVGDSAVYDYEHAGAIVKSVTSPLALAEQLMSV